MLSLRRPAGKAIQSILSEGGIAERFSSLSLQTLQRPTNASSILHSSSVLMGTSTPTPQSKTMSTFSRQNTRGKMSSDNNTNAGRRRGNNYPNPKLRTHAVSVLDGDYSDYTFDDNDDEIDDDDFEAGQTLYNKFGNDDKWDIKNYDSNAGGPAEELDKDELLQREREKEAYEQQKEMDDQKARWLENAKPPVRVPEIDERGRSYGKGGRKVCTARVWIYPGEGVITINRREFLDFFPRETDREMILSPFVATKTCGMFDMIVQVDGGGVTGKAGAIRHGLARALEKYNPDYRPPMKRLGYMTRDSRMVERKKIGKKKARKAPQWVRR